MLYCRECEYSMPSRDIACEHCGLHNTHQIYWYRHTHPLTRRFSFKRHDLTRLLDWFDQHPEQPVSYCESSLCLFCSLVSFTYLSCSPDISTLLPDDQSFHSHEGAAPLRYMVRPSLLAHRQLRSLFTRQRVEAMKDALLYTKPCQHVRIVTASHPIVHPLF